MPMNPRARADAFFTSRQAVLRAKRFAEKLQQLDRPSLSAIRYETPRVQTSGGGSPQQSWLCTVERIRQAAGVSAAEAETAQRKARLFLDQLPLARALFCEAYYVLGLTLEEAAEIADRSPRQCQRIMREIFTYDNTLPIEDPDKETALEDSPEWHDGDECVELPPERPTAAPRPGARQPALKAATGAHRAARAQNPGLAAPQAQVGP